MRRWLIRGAIALAVLGISIWIWVSLERSARASRERNAARVLKTLAGAEADFRGNDRDGNHIQDFWAGQRLHPGRQCLKGKLD